jgi:fatty-acyl-CoA synthase
MTLPQALFAVARALPRRTALVYGARRDTFAQLAADVRVLSGRLRPFDVERGALVALLLPPGRDFVRFFFAVLEAGGTCLLVNPGAKATELRAILAEAQPNLVVAVNRVSGNDLEVALAAALDSSSVRHVLFTGETAPPWARTVQSLGSSPETGAPPTDSVGPDDVAVIFHTSGTTGAAKGVMHTHRTLIQSVLALEAMRAEFFQGSAGTKVRRLAALVTRYQSRLLRVAGKQVWMTPMAPHTIAGFRIVLQAMLAGHRLVVIDRFHPRETVQVIAREGVTVLAATPTMIEAILMIGDLDRSDLSSLAVVGVGGASVSPDLVRRAREAFGCPVVVGYGSTETGGGVLVTRLQDTKRQQAETVGQPFPDVELRIVDDRRDDVANGQVGELACRMPGLMAGYRWAPEGAQVIGEDRWYYTGDLAVMDDSGRVRIVGRKQDVIVRGGAKVFPAEVEQVLKQHPDVGEATVVGVPSAVAGETVWAFVVPAGGKRLSAGQLRRYCAAHLAVHKVPDHVRLRDALPLTDSGEVRRFVLREEALRELKGLVGRDHRSR